MSARSMNAISWVSSYAAVCDWASWQSLTMHPKEKSFASNHIFIWQCILKYFIFWNMYWIWPWNIVALFKIVSCCINFYIDEYTEKTNFNSVIDVRRAPLAGTSATIMMTYAVRTMQKRPSITIRNCITCVLQLRHIFFTHLQHTY